MQEVIDCIIESITFIDLVQIIVAGVTAFAAIALVMATIALIRVTKRKPFAVCTIESSEIAFTALNVVIRNTGNATAFDINTKITPPIPNPDGKMPEGETETNLYVSILPPEQGFPHRVFQSWNSPVKKFNVNISWASKPNGWEWQRKSLTYIIDNSDELRSGFIVGGVHKITQELVTFNKQLKLFKKQFEKIVKYLEPPQDKP